MPQLGMSKGLAFVNDWEGDIDRLYQREEYAATVKARKEQDAQFWANQLKRGHASTPYLEGRYDSFAKDLTRKIADFAIANPGFRTDVTKLAEFQNMTGQLLDNDILREDLQVQANFERLQQQIVSGNMTQSQIEEEMRKYNEYANADPSSKVDPYVFVNPKQVLIPDLITEDASLLAPVSDYRLNNETHRFENITSVPYQNIHATAAGRYATEDGKMAINRDYNAMIEQHPEYKNMDGYEDPLTWYAKRLEMATVKENSPDQYDYAWQLKEQNNASGGGGNASIPYAYYNRVSKFSGIPDGANNGMNATYLDIAFTKFGEIGKTAVINASTDDMLWNPGDPDKNNEGAKLEKVPFNVSAKAENVEEIVNIGGIYYAKTKVSFDIGGERRLGSSVMNIDQATLEKYGFTSGETVSNPLFEQPSNATTFGSGQTVTGYVYTPTIINETTMTNYDYQFLGAAQAKDTAPWYTENTDSILLNDFELFNSEFKQGRIPAGAVPYSHPTLNNGEKGRYYIIETSDGKYAYDKINEEFYKQ